jgi:hypothetical protein
MRPKGMQCLPSLRATGERKVVGLHELATGQAESRAKVATSIARLEHERVGLQDRLTAHAAIRAELEARLEHVHEQLKQLRTRMDAQLGEEAASPGGPEKETGHGHARRREAGAQGHAASQESFEVVSLEY